MNTFSDDLKKLMEIWNRIMEGVKRAMPDASDEAVYNQAKKIMNQFLGIA